MHTSLSIDFPADLSFSSPYPTIKMPPLNIPIVPCYIGKRLFVFCQVRSSVQTRRAANAYNQSNSVGEFSSLFHFVIIAGPAIPCSPSPSLCLQRRSRFLARPGVRRRSSLHTFNVAIQAVSCLPARRVVTCRQVPCPSRQERSVAARLIAAVAVL